MAGLFERMGLVRTEYEGISMPATTPTLDRRCLLNVQRLSPSISSLAVLIRTV